MVKNNKAKLNPKAHSSKNGKIPISSYEFACLYLLYS